MVKTVPDFIPSEVLRAGVGLRTAWDLIDFLGIELNVPVRPLNNLLRGLFND